MPTLAEIDLPELECDAAVPQIGAGEYEERLRATAARLRPARLDVLVVYADREHAANLAFLTGVEPRFEEALLVLDADGRRTLLVGNECLGYLPDPALRIATAVFQDFSLLGQSRAASRPLRAILADCGVAAGRAIGCVGWKWYDPRLVEGGERALDLPSYIADTIRSLAGDRGRVVNAAGLFVDPRDGLRVRNSAAQLAVFEHAAGVASRGVGAAVRSIRPGASEREVARAFAADGLPLSCHPMVSFGDKAQRGLSSPGDGRARVGDAYTLAFGVWGGLSARAGFVVADATQLPREVADIYPRFAANFFAVMVAWYQAVRVGATGGEVVAAVEAARDPALYDFALNPGHYLHLDEWLHSPFIAGDATPLPSGVAIQMDIIPAAKVAPCCANGEDGIALADRELREAIARERPAMWTRIQRRRRFMIETLGIALDESVLPLSAAPGWLAPYALSPRLAFVNR
ncbi:MAG TPA: M24 family metallopeptidase [Planctomycetota bacterium]|nr:M24 family metallopeptidase [Planctomycetota bacterium]